MLAWRGRRAEIDPKPHCGQGAHPVLAPPHPLPRRKRAPPTGLQRLAPEELAVHRHHQLGRRGGRPGPCPLHHHGAERVREGRLHGVPQQAVVGPRLAREEERALQDLSGTARAHAWSGWRAKRRCAQRRSSAGYWAGPRGRAGRSAAHSRCSSMRRARGRQSARHTWPGSSSRPSGPQPRRHRCPPRSGPMSLSRTLGC